MLKICYIVALYIQVHLYYSQQLHINLIKYVYMHFSPHLNHSERQTCARTRIDKSLKLANYKLKRVTAVKLLCAWSNY